MRHSEKTCVKDLSHDQIAIRQNQDRLNSASLRVNWALANALTRWNYPRIMGCPYPGREALQRLRSGLAEHLPRRGTFVSAPSHLNLSKCSK